MNYLPVIQEVSKIVTRLSGIQLGDKQLEMVESRLKSRMIKLGVKTPEEYLHYLKSNEAIESQALLSLMTTHHTYFFREFSHFEYLAFTYLPQWVDRAKKTGNKKLRIWSAACSRGQEVYSMAMLLNTHLKAHGSDFEFEIWGSDVDPESVAIANNAVYNHKELSQVPSIYLDGNWARGSGDIADFAKVKKHLKDRCHFLTFNLTDNAWTPPAGGHFDIIFCRNVFIYFSQDDIKKITKNLLKSLHSEGLLFIGVSESLTGIEVPAKAIGPSIFSPNMAKSKDLIIGGSAPASRDLGMKAKATGIAPKPASVPTPAVVASVPQGPFKILCVDDSPSILALLKKILVPEVGYIVSATASNGREALDLLKRQTFDAITLDIHMPEMDGIEFLKQSGTAGRPPVVMLSSVNRDNADLAVKALDLGAADYIEKPTLANLDERSDEIKSKLRMAVLMKNSVIKHDLDHSFQRKFQIKGPELKRRWAFFSLGDRKKIALLAKMQSHIDPALIIVLEANEAAVDVLKDGIQKETGVALLRAGASAKPGATFLITLDEAKAVFAADGSGPKSSVFLSSIATKKMQTVLNSVTGYHLILDDLGPNARDVNKEYIGKSAFKAPVTSFFSITEELFVKSEEKKSA